jgi:hypothetical protein
MGVHSEQKESDMKKSVTLLTMLLIAGCDLTSGNPLEDRMRADALSRASSDCGAAGSCRVSIVKNGTDFVVTVSPSAIGTVGDPQFNSGAVHHYQYDSSGTFVRETPD